METTSTLSLTLLQAVTAEPEIAEKVQALVETTEEMIRSNTDAEKLTALEQLADVAGCRNGASRICMGKAGAVW